MSESLVIASKCKSYLQEEHQLRCSAEALGQLSAEVKELLDKAAANAKTDHRATLKARDFEL
jgi:hypothetical protein